MTRKIGKRQYGYIYKFFVFNIILVIIIYLSNRLVFLEDVVLIPLFIFGGFPLYVHFFDNMILDGILFIDLFLVWILIVFNFWFYIFIRKKKGNRKWEFIALLIYVIVMIFLWFYWLISEGGIFSL